MNLDYDRMVMSPYRFDPDMPYEHLKMMTCASMCHEPMSTVKDESASPDSDIMLTGLKKDKICLVCGDKALGCNFNAVSCESCKAFFRRNAHKTIRGRCEGKCDVNIESRSFCKRCRLAKCFTVGMRKDMILDDDQKRVRKQKILINKLRRRGSIPGDEVGMVTETSPGVLLPKSEETLRQLYPNLTDKDIDILCEKKPEADSKQDNKLKKTKIEPWSDVKESVFQIIEDLDPADKDVLQEMNKAHESSSFLTNTETKLKALPSSATDMFNIADGFVRRIIKVAKQLEYFRAVDKDDQIALLKGSVVEIMMLRSAVNFDIKTESWSLSTISCIKSENQPGTSSEGGGLDIAALRKAALEGADFETLRNMARGGATCPTVPSPVTPSPPPTLPPVGRRECRNLTNPFFPTGSLPNVPNPGLDRIREAASAAGMDIEALRMAAMGGASYDHLAKMAHGVNCRDNPGMDVEMLRKAALSGASFEQLSKMAHNNVVSSGMDINALHTTAKNEASHEQLSRMAHENATSSVGTPNASLPVDLTKVKIELPSGFGLPQQSSESQKNTPLISSEILKSGNSETKAMFLTYSKFIRSLMFTIRGDLIILKFLIMLSLFSPDRHGISNRDLICYYQEKYAQLLEKYIHKRFPDEKNMFARCVMKLTDLRNVNEVHTKMLQKMHVEQIEPLLVEIFDLS